MNAYLAVKALHIISSVVLTGTGFGTAFYFFFANRTRSVPVIAAVSRLVVRADFWFTAPAAVFQPLSGLWLAQAAGWGWETPWLIGSVVLFLLAGVCWLPVVKLQLHMADMAARAQAAGQTTLPPRYWRCARLWEWLGYPAFGSMIAVYFLMVTKPTLAGL
ncbi:DUF2269 family protein [Cupriavidus sp. 2TAF22]|uniref:DUF2269 family protein n=1 Tax=unclassified Cupriavidus TaxID=2640874 RepID=UPI003F93A3F6